jgi:heptosyltransferase-2
MHVDKILIRGPNWVGDSVLAIPAMKALRAQFPNAEITLLVRPWVAGLFTSASFIDRVWSEARPKGISSWSKITRSIREHGFDLAVLFPNSFESALMMFLGRIPKRLGYATDGRGLLLTDAVRTPGESDRHQVFYYLDLVKNVAQSSAKPSIEIKATDAEKSEARRLLEAEGVGRNERFLVLNPGAAYGSAKRWDEKRFAEAGDRLALRFGLRIVTIGSGKERSVAEQIRTHAQTPVSILTGRTSLETLIGVLSESSLMVTNDSGPMHIAAALGIPTVAIFGPTDDRVTAPFAPHTRIVKQQVDCSPCLLRECPIDHRCMTRVTTDAVCRAAEELLAHA